MENQKTWDFDGWAANYDTVVARGSGVHMCYDKVLEHVAEVARIRPGKLVLDIGTGTGNLAIKCLLRGARVVGLDPSPKMLAVAREKLGDDPRVEFLLVADPFLHIPFPDGRFDAVVSTYSFHHVTPLEKPRAVREMVRVLKRGGVWALGDLVFWDEQAEREALRRLDWLEEEYFSKIVELRGMFAELGMELEAKQFTPVTWVLWAVKPA
jgi:putative AdoMet-dependent methyltransferase